VTLLIGIDAGGTKLAAGVVDVTSGQLLRRQQVPADAGRGGAAVLADCLALATGLARLFPVRAVGLGIPELITPDGEITTAAAWDWRGDDLPAAFAPIGPLHIESDVRAAALGEARLGAGRALSSFLYLSIGTGISHTLVIGGRPWRGSRGNALVVGAPMVELSFGGHQLAAQAGKARAEDVLACAADEPVVARAAGVIGAELARLVNAVDPEAVVIGGGLGLVAEFRERVAAAARPLIYAEATARLPIVPAALARDAGIIGAALACADRCGEDWPEHEARS
jgi:glucokinase